MCVEECPRHLNPLCGSDGKTYGNECTFAAGKCKSNGNLTLKHRGPCGLDDAGNFCFVRQVTYLIKINCSKVIFTTVDA